MVNVQLTTDSKSSKTKSKFQLCCQCFPPICSRPVSYFCNIKIVAGSRETLDKQWPKIAWSSYFCCKFTGYFYRQLKGSRPIFQRKASLYSGLATANSRKLFQNPIQKLISYLVPRLLGKSDTFLVCFETVTVLVLGFQCRLNLSAVVNIYVVIVTSCLPQKVVEKLFLVEARISI